MGSEQHYSLRWNDYTVKIVTAFQSLRDEEDFVDVTVACDGHSYSAHKMVLSACSPYFRALLRANPCQHPIVILKDVGHVELERLLEFMYNGEVSIAQDQLAAFLKTAENLKIRGLAGSSDDLDQAGIHRPDVSYSYSSGAGGGATSGRSSPSAGYAPSQGSKDDDLVGEGGGGGGSGGGGGGSSSYHTRPDSPPPKRRKRSSAPASSHIDPNTITHTSEGVCEASVEGIEGGGSLSSAGLPGDDELRLDRREMKSEPAMPGPSGSVGSQDGVGTHEPGAAPGGAVCEALNLSLRPPLAQANGYQPLLPPPPPPPPSPHHHHHHQQQQQHHYHHHQPPLPPPHHHHQSQQLHHHQHQQSQQLHNVHHHHQQQQHHQHQHQHQQQQQQQQQQEQHHQHQHQHQHQQQMVNSAAPTMTHTAATETCETFEVKINPVAAATGGLVYPDDALDLAGPDAKMAGLVVVGGPEIKEEVGLLDTPPEYKTKLYPCPECHKVFRHPMSLHHHRHVHKGTYTCHSCGKVFSRRWDLHRHLHRSKMGCRRPNHVVAPVAVAPPVVPQPPQPPPTATPHRAEFALDLNNPPSN